MPSIVGTWKLVRAIARDAGGKELPSPYGPKALGRVTFTAEHEDFVLIQTHGGQSGWVAKGNVGRVAP